MICRLLSLSTASVLLSIPVLWAAYTSSSTIAWLAVPAGLPPVWICNSAYNTQIVVQRIVSGVADEVAQVQPAVAFIYPSGLQQLGVNGVHIHGNARAGFAV